MAEKKTKILFKRSSVPDRVPSANTLDYGEIALNYASGTGKSFISLKKANDTIAQFMEKDYNDANYANKALVDTIDANLEALKQDVIDDEKAIATALNTINESAGFDNGGNSTLGMSLTKAIVGLQTDVDDLESNLSDNYATSANTVAAIKVVQDDVDILRQDVIDNELITATALNTINESAGFDEMGNSTLRMSLTDAIIALQAKVDALEGMVNEMMGGGVD